MSNSSLVSYTLWSPNHSGKRNHAIDRITPHCFVGQVTAKRGCEVFQPSSRQASCQYVIGYDGGIGQNVDEANRSWCSSSSENDNRAVTIEVASDTTHPYAVTDKAFAALLDLCTDICRRNGKTKLLWLADKAKTLAYQPKENEMLLSVHRWFAAKACPGDYIYNRLGEIAAEVTKRLGGSTAAAEPPAQTTTTAASFSIGDTVEFTEAATRYNPASSGIPAWVKNGYTHIITQTTANGQSVIKGGERCVLLGKKTNRTTGKTEAGINTWVSEKNLRAVVTASGSTTTVEAFKSYRIKVTTDDLNIRKGPGTGFAVVGAIKDKGVYTIVLEDATAKWGKLKSGAGWICLEYTKKV